MFENNRVQILHALEPQFGLRRALGPILRQPLTYYHPNLTAFYNINVVWWVSDDAESISNTSFVFESSKSPFGLLIFKKEPKSPFQKPNRY